ncbi:hypothetical protein QBC38DRAFT_219588 [Podospora fimiseda]|uniref:Uncharacterized protein n=1 Tax=Podospora fimiseda TaxID=252190 RepID=A0AAN7H358_9PEZI|nr:hypothetical protein QBC38DRAFT_219588 [Podospora fimiseda]
MRYDDWDVILFPIARESNVPMKEFKVACHVVPDHELSHLNGATNPNGSSPGLMPVMTCFVPSLPAGHPFQISLHSWTTPKISTFTKTAYSKHLDLVKFEARVLLDGRLVASAILDKKEGVPCLITSTFEFTKTGELERLRFPMFRRELLFHDHWYPNDDIGRIKVVISEGFPRDSLSVPIERVKNVVVFSFQHAPLEILETNEIAWPNPSMWRQGSITPQVNNSAAASPMLVPTYHPNDGWETHAHSPRKNISLRNVKSHTGFPVSLRGGLFGQQQQSPFQQQQVIPLAPSSYISRNDASGSGVNGGLFGYTNPSQDPFTENAYLEWVAANMANQSASRSDGASLWPSMMMGQQRNGSLGRKKSTSGDAIMSDYICPVTSMHGHYGESMQTSSDGTDDLMFGSIGSGRSGSNGGNEGTGRIGVIKVPTNTPVTGPVGDYQQQMMGTCTGDIGGGSSLWAQSLFNSNSSHGQPWKKMTTGIQQEDVLRARRDLGLGLGTGLGMGIGGMGLGGNLHQANALVGEMRSGDYHLRGGDGGIMTKKYSQQQQPAAVMLESAGKVVVQDQLDHSPLSSDSGGSAQEDKDVEGGVSVGGEENVPPEGVEAVFSGSSSRNASAGDLSTTGGVDLLTETTNSSGVSGSGTPRLGVGERPLSGGGMKRTRNFTPASARAIDEEDEPRRGSPHVRIAAFGVGDVGGAGGGGGEGC